MSKGNRFTHCSYLHMLCFVKSHVVLPLKLALRSLVYAIQCTVNQSCIRRNTWTYVVYVQNKTNQYVTVRVQLSVSSRLRGIRAPAQREPMAS